MQRTTPSISSSAEIITTGISAQRGLVLDMLQDLKAVHLRHHHVEQDEVEIVQPQLLEASFPEAAVNTL